MPYDLKSYILDGLNAIQIIYKIFTFDDWKCDTFNEWSF